MQNEEIISIVKNAFELEKIDKLVKIKNYD